MEKEKQQRMCLPMMQNYSFLLDLRPLKKQKQQNLKEGSKPVFLRLLPRKVNTGSMKDESLEVQLRPQQAEREYPNTFGSFKSNQKKKVNNLRASRSVKTAHQGWRNRPDNDHQKDRNRQNLQRVRTPKDKWKCRSVLPDRKEVNRLL